MITLALCLWLTTVAPPPVESFTATTAARETAANHRRSLRPRWLLIGQRPPWRLLLAESDGSGKDGNGGGSGKKRIQRDLLLDLDSRLNYEGRISSKMAISEPVTADSEASPPPTSPSRQHRCALLTIMGNPNRGKSTLLNSLLSEDLAVSTSRPQTTRHAILGVLTTDFVQLCVTDTPGIISEPAYRLQERMMDAVRRSMRDADILLVVTDVFSGVRREKSGDGDGGPDDSLGMGKEMLAEVRRYNKPVIVCVNKVDLVAEDDSSVYYSTPARAVEIIQRWRSALPDAFAILPTCAAGGPDDPGVVALRSILLANDPSADVGAAIRALGRPVPGMFASIGMISTDEARQIVPFGPPLYDPDFFTDRTDRFCASELIRGVLFRSLGKELPYCCEVRVGKFEDSRNYPETKTAKRKTMIRIGATIHVERDSQKGIVVGKSGSKIKSVGMDSRKKLQEFFGCKVFLDLRVKVDKNWRNDADKLKKYGYM